jgi:hypothetical protein
MFKTQLREKIYLMFGSLGFWSFEFVSDFDIRISHFRAPLSGLEDPVLSLQKELSSASATNAYTNQSLISMCFGEDSSGFVSCPSRLILWYKVELCHHEPETNHA